MELGSTIKLSPEQKKQIQQLEAHYQKKEGGRLSFPVTDGCFFALAYEDGQLVSALSLFSPDSTLYECMAYTCPQYRKSGYFSRLFDLALDYLEQLETDHGTEADLCLLWDGTCQATQAVLAALEAQYWYSEYSMEFSFCWPIPGTDTASALTIDVLSSHTQEPCAYQIKQGRQVIGKFYTTSPDLSLVYFYGFEIHQPFHGQGLGTAAFVAILKYMKQLGYQKLTLQVSQTNQAACHLYQKTGLHITETLSYYWY